jgi:hypothetical protein
MVPEREVSLERIERMLGRIKGRLMSIWLPPKSYPQFYGIIMPAVTVTKTSAVRCRLRKYILFKQAISSRLFEGILEYLS